MVHERRADILREEETGGKPMKDFLECVITVLFLALFFIFAGCMLCSPLKGDGKDGTYNDIKDGTNG